MSAGGSQSRLLAVAACVVALHGCSLQGSDLSPLTTASLPPARAPAACSEVAAKSAVSVQDVLAQARGKAGTAPAPASVRQGDGHASGPSEVQKYRHSSDPSARCAGKPPAQPGDARAVDPPSAAGSAPNGLLNPDLTITFDAAARSLGAKERQVVIAAGRAHKKAGGKEIRIYAGAGSVGNPFDQIVVAENRARHVRTLLPSDMLLMVEYDPGQDEDTVRIEFVRKS